MCSSLTMESTQRLYIRLSEEYKEFLNSGEWDHGIVVTDLNPYVTNSELHSFFQTFGTITECNIKIDKSSGWPKGVGFVRYSSSEEAEAAQADGSHNLGGFPIWVNKVVTPKLNEACQINTPQDQSFQPNVHVN